MHSLDAQTAVLLDEHPIWLEAVEGVLHRIGIQVTGKTTSPSEALTLVEETRPDLLVAELGDANGGADRATFLAKARQLVPHLRTIVLSVHADSHHIETALGAGAAAYVVKTAHADDLASAVRQAFNQSVYAAGARSASPLAPPTESNVGDAGLTRREREILQLVAEGHSNAQLARMLWVTEQTVKFHLSNIYRKLDVSNRTEASRWAQRNGLLPEAGSGEEPSAASAVGYGETGTPNRSRRLAHFDGAEGDVR
jgi:two-component system response regulator DevR